MRAGFGRALITPQKPMFMAGFDRRTAPSTGTLDELYVSVLILEDSYAELFAFCSFDVLGVDSQLCREVRSTICDATTLEEDQIWVSSTHTHSAPSHIFHNGSTYDRAFVDFLLEQTSQAAKAAFFDLAPCEPKVAHTYAVGVASLRNQGRQGADFPMPVHVTKLIREKDSLSFCLFACHPTILDEKNTLFSKDIPGAAAAVLPEGNSYIFLNGACADLSTRFTRQGSSPEELQRIGGILGRAIADADYTWDRSFGERIRASQQTIYLSRAASLDGEERTALLTALREKAEACADSQMRREYDSRIAVLERSAVGAEKDRPIRVSAVDFGPYLLLSLPFEVDNKDGQELECILSEAAGKPVYVVCYTGGYDGYLPSGKPLSVDSSYEDIASRYLPQSRGQVWESAKECVQNARI